MPLEVNESVRIAQSKIFVYEGLQYNPLRCLFFWADESEDKLVERLYLQELKSALNDLKVTVYQSHLPEGQLSRVKQTMRHLVHIENQVNGVLRLLMIALDAEQLTDECKKYLREAKVIVQTRHEVGTRLRGEYSLLESFNRFFEIGGEKLLREEKARVLRDRLTALGDYEYCQREEEWQSISF